MVYLLYFDEIVQKLEIDIPKICEWLHRNGFKVNSGKYYFY